MFKLLWSITYRKMPKQPVLISVNVQYKASSSRWVWAMRQPSAQLLARAERRNYVFGIRPVTISNTFSASLKVDPKTQLRTVKKKVIKKNKKKSKKTTRSRWNPHKIHMASLKSLRFSLRSTLPHLFGLLRSYDLSNKIIDSECDTRRRKFMKELNYLIKLIDKTAWFCDFDKGTYYRGHAGSDDLFTLNRCGPPFHSYGKDTAAASMSRQSACGVRSCAPPYSVARAIHLEVELECSKG